MVWTNAVELTDLSGFRSLRQSDQSYKGPRAD